MKITVCDDDKAYAAEIKEYVSNILDEHKIQADFTVFSQSDELYSSESHYDMAFLDIEMTPFNGIEITQKLKEINPYIVIFIITSYEKYLDDAMDLNVFRYIKKPVDVRRLRKSIIKALEHIDNNMVSVFMKIGKTSVSIPVNDIVFIETIGRSTKVITVDNEYISDKKVSFWNEKLISSFFCQVHKSYIINMKHISDYKRDSVTLSEKYTVPISYRKQAEFRSYFLKFFGGH